MLEILEEALVAAEFAEVLLATCDEDDPVVAADARMGLQLRLRFANLHGWLDDVECRPEHREIQSQAATLLTYYLHMITSSFEARFSPLTRDRYTIMSREHSTETAHSRLLKLRDALDDSLNCFPA